MSDFWFYAVICFICYLSKGSQMQGLAAQHAVLTVSTWFNLEILGTEKLIIII